MASEQGSYQQAIEAARARLVTAQNNPRVPTDQDKIDVDKITAAAIELATQIEMRCPAGRNKSLALTHLEDTLTRANKAIYVDHA